MNSTDFPVAVKEQVIAKKFQTRRVTELRLKVQQCAAQEWVDFPNYADFFHASLVCANFSNAKTDGVEEESDLTAATATADGINHFSSWCFTLENVAGYQDSESWNHIIRPALKDYSVWSGVLNCTDYGVPQNRKRFIVIAVREADFPVIPPPAWDTQLGWFDVIAPWWDALPQSTLTEAQERAVKGKSGIYLIPRLGYRNELPPVIAADDPAPTIRKSIFLDDKGATRNRFLDIWSDGDTRNLTIPAVGYGLQTFPEWYEFPESGGTAGAIIGYSVPPLFFKQIVEWVLPLLGHPHKGKEFHELCKLLPSMQPEEFTELVVDIKAYGLLEPIWLYEGKILDGRSRYQACLLAGVEPRFIQWQGDHQTPVQFVLAKNLRRRQLTSSQCAVVALNALPFLEEEAHERQIELGSTGGRGNKKNLPELIPEGFNKGRAESRTQAAKLTGTNPRYVCDAKKLSVKAPDLLEEVRMGKKTIPQAMRDFKRTELSASGPSFVPEIGELVRSGKRVGKILKVNGSRCTVQIWQEIEELEIKDIAPVESEEISTSISKEDYAFLLSLGISGLHQVVEMLKDKKPPK